MIILTRLIATIIDVTALLAVSLALAIVDQTLAAVRAGLAPPPWWQPWDDLVKLGRKRRLRPAFASPLYSAWPVVALAASGAAALIVPGFAFGLISAPLATVPVLIGLLALAATARLAAMLESGEGARGLAASRAAARLLLGAAVWLIALGVLAVRAGSLALSGIGGGIAGMAGGEPLVLLAGLAATLTLRCFAVPDPADYAGPERAMFQAEAVVRRVVMLAALIDLIAPLPMADARLIFTWPLGLLAWIIKIMLLAGVTALIAPRRYAMWLGVACAIAAAALLVMQEADAPGLLVASGGAIGVVGLVWLIRRGPVLEVASLVQLGVAVIGLGIGATQGAFLILAMVVLARGAAQLAGRVPGLIAALCAVAMAGLPPFGGFAGDFAVLRAGFALDPWLGGFMLLAMTLTAITLISRLPATLPRPKAEPRVLLAGICLAIALALGVAPWLIAGLS
ncbi:MAG: hypothetical protein PHT60_01445 [Acidiphilium sp.]|nr:hypothetical protein [Acidiphilium sp.]MDD4934420.1 hypothetical protein [Acidiphilium sp.]